MINIQGYNFEGPFAHGTKFNDIGAVYAVYTNNVWLDFGESGQVGTRIANHDREPQWKWHANGMFIWIAVLPENNPKSRLAIEAYLRSSLKPLCGER